MKYFLYQHIRLDTNEVFYIGIGTKRTRQYTYQDTYSRAFDKSTRNKFWKHITNKTEYKIDIIEESNDYEYMKTKEIELIKFYGRRDLNKGSLVNLTNGGQGMLSYTYTDKHKKKISESLKGRKKSEEYWHKMKSIWISNEKKEKIKEMYLNGDKVKDILKELHTSYITVTKVLEEFNIPKIRREKRNKINKDGKN